MTALRLTAGWRQTGRAATLREHLNVHGPFPGGAGPWGQSPGAPRRGQRGHDSRSVRAGQRAGWLAEAVAEAGLTGRGGAGFPTGTKLRAVAARRGPAVVVANGMESEPASEKDQALLSLAPHLVLDGAVLAAEAVRADIAHVCLSRGRPGLAGLVRRAVAERRGRGIDPVPIEVHELPQHYVSSEETSIIRWLNGGEARPLATPPRPFERGVGRRPTLVDNVETLAHIALIARYGPHWFRRAGLPDAPGTMLITVSGAVAAPGVYEVELGTPIAEVLAGARAGQLGAVLIGGYFGTWHDPRAVAGLRLDPAGLRAAGASIGAGVLVALPAAACGLIETARVLGYLAEQGARQCGPCAFGLPAIADDFTQLASGRSGGAVLARLERRLGVITGRGACRHPDGAVRMAASALSAFAADAQAHSRRMPCPAARRGSAGRRALPIPRPFAEGDWR